MNLKPLKILIVYDCIYPESLGGVEHRNYQLAKYLGDRHYDITLAGWTKNNQSSLQNVSILPLNFRSSLYNQEGKRTALISLKFAFSLFFLPWQKYDLILTDNIPYIHLFPLLLLTFINRKKVIITWHEYWAKYWQKYIKNQSWIIFFILEILAVQLGQKVIAVSQFTANRLSKYRINKSPIIIVYNGVNLKQIISVTKHLKKSDFSLVYVGRLIKEKRVDLLIQAMAKLPPNLHHVTLKIIGEGKERNNLENLVNQLNLGDQISFTGGLNDINQVWQQLAIAKIAIQPSEREGFGMFPLEAMAVGTPVIYCNSLESAVSEIVRDGIEGIAVNSNAEDLALAIANLLNNDEQWQRLSKNAEIRSKNFDWEKITDKMESIFKEILD